jgi:hypothetical protein
MARKKLDFESLRSLFSRFIGAIRPGMKLPDNVTPSNLLEMVGVILDSIAPEGDAPDEETRPSGGAKAKGDPHQSLNGKVLSAMIDATGGNPSAFSALAAPTNPPPMRDVPGRKRYVKEVLRVGSYLSSSGPRDFGTDDLNQIVEAFNGQQKRGIRPPLQWDHWKDAATQHQSIDQVITYLTDAWVENGDSLWVAFYPKPEDEARLADEDWQVSVLTVRDQPDSTGKKWPIQLQHVAIVPRAAMADQSSFAALGAFGGRRRAYQGTAKPVTGLKKRTIVTMTPKKQAKPTGSRIAAMAGPAAARTQRHKTPRHKALAVDIAVSRAKLAVLEGQNHQMQEAKDFEAFASLHRGRFTEADIAAAWKRYQ